MGKTVAMKRLEELMRQKELKKEGDTGIDVLTNDMKEKAGLDVKYVKDFSGGCSGLKRVKKK